MTRRELFEATKHARRPQGVIVTAIALAVFAANIFAAPPAQNKKLTQEELIARHLESIGSAEARAAATSRRAGGDVTLAFRIGGAGNLLGDGMMVSTGQKLRFGMRFRAIDYPVEDMAFDGARAATGFLPKGGRSQLSAFLSQQDAPLKEGLMGGVLSTAWPLLRVEQQNPRLEYRGLKKIDGRELHELSYRPRKSSSDLKIALYFDPATFRHVLTQYSFQIGAGIVTRDAPGQSSESHYSLTETFDDFRAVDGLTLPHKYRLQLSIQGATGSALYDYNLAIKVVSHKETFDDKLFTLK